MFIFVRLEGFEILLKDQGLVDRFWFYRIYYDFLWVLKGKLKGIGECVFVFFVEKWGGCVWCQGGVGGQRGWDE